MPDGSAPSSDSTQNPKALLQQTEAALARLHGNAASFSESLSTLTDGVTGWVGAQPRSTGMSQRLADLNETSKDYLSKTRAVQTQTKQLVDDLRDQMAKFDDLDQTQQQAVAETFAAQAARLTAESDTFGSASDHLAETQRYLRTKADSFDAVDTDAGNELRELGTRAAHASEAATDTSESLTPMRNVGNNLNTLKENLAKKQVDAPTPETKAKFKEAREKLEGLRDAFENERAALERQRTAAEDALRDVHVDDSEDAANQHADRRDLGMREDAIRQRAYEVQKRLDELDKFENREGWSDATSGRIAADISREADESAASARVHILEPAQEARNNVSHWLDKAPVQAGGQPQTDSTAPDQGNATDTSLDELQDLEQKLTQTRDHSSELADTLETRQSGYRKQSAGNGLSPEDAKQLAETSQKLLGHIGAAADLAEQTEEALAELEALKTDLPNLDATARASRIQALGSRYQDLHARSSAVADDANRLDDYEIVDASLQNTVGSAVDNATKASAQIATPAPNDTIPLVDEEVVITEPGASSQPVLRTAPPDEPSISSAPASGTPATALGAPLATSVLGASVAAQNGASTDNPDDRQDADQARRAARLEEILKQLDAEEGALNARFDALAANKRLSKTLRQQEQANILEAHAALEQKRLDLLQEHGSLPTRNGVAYDAASLQANIAHALEQVQKVRPLAQVTVAPLPAAPAASAGPAPDLAQVGQAVAQAFAVSAQAPAANEPTREPTVAELRDELRAERKVQSQNAKVLGVYQERVQARSLEWLQRNDPVRYAQWQTLQSKTTVTIDASTFLTTAEQQAVQVTALTDVRAQFPEVNESQLSDMLIAKAAATLVVADAFSKEATLAGTAAFLSQAQKTSSSAIVATLAPMAMGLLKEIDNTRGLLRNAEGAEIVRSSQIRALTANTPLATPLKSGETIDTLRQDQRDSSAKRRALQAALQGQLGALGMIRQLAQKALSDTQDPQALEAGALVVNLLEQHGHHATKAMPPLTRSSTNSASEPAPSANVGGAIAPPVTATQAARVAPNDQADSAAHEASIIARLQAGKLNDQRFARSGGSGAGGGTATSGSSASGASAVPLLALPVVAASPQAQFALDQANTANALAQFTGDSSVPGGYEASLGPDAVESGEVRTQTVTIDDGPEIEEGESELSTEEIEAYRASELMQQQQLAARAQNQAEDNQAPGAQGGAGLMDAANQLRNLPGGQQAATAAAKAAVANPAGILILVLVAFFWLNARLLFPKEDSFFRKPMGTAGKVGTIAFDILFVIILLVSLIITIVMAVVPFLPFLLPLIGAFAILQAAIHLFGT